MLPSSHISSRLRKLYSLVLTRMHQANLRVVQASSVGRTSARRGSIDPLESRVMLSASPEKPSYISDNIVDSAISTAIAPVVSQTDGAAIQQGLTEWGNYANFQAAPAYPLSYPQSSNSLGLTSALLNASMSATPPLALPAGLTMAGTAAVPSTALDLPVESGIKQAPANTIYVTPDSGTTGGPTTAGSLVPTHADPVPAGLAGMTLYGTGFESGEGFVPGFIGQNGWGYYSNTSSQPVISNAHPAVGTQHLRIDKHSGLPNGTQIGAVTPNLGTRSAGHYALSVDLAISNSGGADYFIMPFSISQDGTYAAGLRFEWQGSVYALADLTPGDGLFDWVDTGVDWSGNIGAYKNATIELDATANTLTYSYGGAVIYTTTVFGATSIEQAVFESDNWNAGEVADFDNLTINDMDASSPPADLTVGHPENWSSGLPIGIAQLAGGTDHAYSGPYYDNQPLYFNWGSYNTGVGPATNYTVKVQVTGQGGGSFLWSGLSTPSDDLITLTNDQVVGPLAAGTHTFRVWLDYADTNDENDELNNYFEQTITVLPAGTPAAQPLTLAPLGVSPGVNWVQQPGQIAGFGGEQSYSLTLTAGQRISASVQTPGGGGNVFGTVTAVAIRTMAQPLCPRSR